MKRLLLIGVVLVVAGLVGVTSCGKNGKTTPAPESNVESVAAPDAAPAAEPVPEPEERIRITPVGTAPSLKNVMSMDDVEHKLPVDWRKYEIVVTGQKGKGEYEPDMKAIYDAIVEVFPLPMLVQWAWYGADAPGIWERDADIICDQDNFFIGGVWKDPMGNFDDHFELKAWQVNAGTWTVGLNYQPLFDGDDGMGVYGRQLFWFYAPHGDNILYPISTEDCPQPISDDENPVFDRYENAVNFPDAFDPAATRLYWNGWWFEHR